MVLPLLSPTFLPPSSFTIQQTQPKRMPNVAQTVAIDDAQAYITLLNDLTTTRLERRLCWYGTRSRHRKGMAREENIRYHVVLFVYGFVNDDSVDPDLQNRYLPLFTMFYNIYSVILRGRNRKADQKICICTDDFLSNPSSAIESESDDVHSCKAFEMTFFALSFFSVALISCEYSRLASISSR
ncbi:LOW QUALITY PROTEIN: hypothetical protein CVT26_016192 [Gymnopilus dilepis]|uniref:Uncharacterized protein n=1 Tax=Gymnopilus dilepis TaxID=231916 RepID=A0A409XYZ8_9AGAR|nr:LOW QUALITY PROTEIN: hypothetical protein CVT26_016192 [Gymnopilus dilepis]